MPFTTIGENCMAFSAGDVVLVPFPYRDRSAERTRPAVVVSCLAYNQQGDLVIAAVTSHSPLGALDWAEVQARVQQKLMHGRDRLPTSLFGTSQLPAFRYRTRPT